MSKTNRDLLLKILANVKEFKDETNEKFKSIDARFESIDARFQSIDDRIGKIETHIEKTFKNINLELKNINGYIKREADIAEIELSDTVFRHLCQAFQGHLVIPYSDQLKTIKDPFAGNRLTDFDGLFLLKHKDEKRFPNKRILVIVEAKHYITVEKVKAKIAQKSKLEDFIKLVNTPEEFAKTLSKFKKVVQATKLDQVSDVYLYIGGPYWEKAAHSLALAEYNKEKTANGISTIGLINIGERYTIKDFASFAKGGKNKL